MTSVGQYNQALAAAAAAAANANTSQHDAHDDHFHHRLTVRCPLFMCIRRHLQRGPFRRKTRSNILIGASMSLGRRRRRLHQQRPRDTRTSV